MNKENTNLNIYEQVFDSLPIGLILIGQDRTIYAWNSWMTHKTKIEQNIAIGKSLDVLYPNYKSQRFNWALESVLKDGHPQWLSTILNEYVIPIPIPIRNKTHPDFAMMQQNAEILPINYHDQRFALVIIEDVTDKMHLKRTLISMASRFEESSFIDALTGLYNRRFLWKHLDMELKKARQEHYNVACCLFDLDYFKTINDEFGHAAGDEVLNSFAKLAKETITAKDYLIRYGGEEFLVIFTHLKREEAAKIANRLRKKLEKKRVHGAVHKRITCSGGLSYWQPEDPFITAEKLVDGADLQLYKAKRNGRNCIMVAPPV